MGPAITVIVGVEPASIPNWGKGSSQRVFFLLKSKVNLFVFICSFSRWN